MKFYFIHAADLHLGSPFLGLSRIDKELAQRFSSACRDSFTELVQKAIDLEVKFLVIAGDIYDGDWKDTTIGLFFNRELARLQRAGVDVYLLKGNHDAESVITKAVSLPDNVNEFSSRTTTTFRIEELKVAIHGRSFPTRAVEENFAAMYPAPIEGWLNIGVLHTSCNGHPNHPTYAPCSSDELKLKGYDYWALGHVHDYELLSEDPWIVYPGNLQGRNIKESGAKGAVLVEVSDGEICTAERLVVDKARWAVITADIESVEKEAELWELLEPLMKEAVAGATGRLLAFRVVVTGCTVLHNRLIANRSSLEDEIQARLHHVHEDAWLQEVQISTSPKVRTEACSSLGQIDLVHLIDKVRFQPSFRDKVQEEISAIKLKMPGGVTVPLSSPHELDILLSEARALVLGRAQS